MKNRNKLFYGTYSTVLVIVVIALAFFFNYFIAQLEESKALKIDLTSNQVYSLSDITTQAVKRIDQDLYIYFFVPPSYADYKEVKTIRELLVKYAAIGKHIKLEVVDPARETALLRLFSTQDASFPQMAIVIANEDARHADDNLKYRPPIDFQSLFIMDQSDSTKVNAIVAEQRLTSAILSFTDPTSANVWFVKGYDTMQPSDNPYLTAQLQSLGYSVNSFIPATQSAKLKNEDIIVLAGPGSDLSDADSAVIASHIDAGGPVLFFVNPTKQNLPKLNSLLNRYKLAMDNRIIRDTDAEYGYENSVQFVLKLADHDITKTVPTNDTVQMRLACPVSVKDVVAETNKNSSTGESTTQNVVRFGDYTGVVYQLLSTSSSAFLRPAESTTEVKQPGDPTGPFDTGLAYVLTGNGHTSRIALFGSSTLMQSSPAEMPGNFITVTNTINWLADRGDEVSIIGKSTASSYLTLTNPAAFKTTILIILVIVVPLLIMGAGIVIWIKRKNL